MQLVHLGVVSEEHVCFESNLKVENINKVQTRADR